MPASVDNIIQLYHRLVYYNHEMIVNPDLRTTAHYVFYKYVIACHNIKKSVDNHPFIISGKNVLSILQKFLDQLIINYLYHRESKIFECGQKSSWKTDWETFHKNIFTPVFSFVYEYAFRAFSVQPMLLESYGKDSFKKHWNSIGASYRIMNCLPAQIGRKIRQQY